MVGLVSKAIVPIDDKINKMSDSNGKDDAVDDKSDGPLSNGTETNDIESAKFPNNSEDKKMDVDVEEETEAKPLTDGAEENITDSDDEEDEEEESSTDTEEDDDDLEEKVSDAEEKSNVEESDTATGVVSNEKSVMGMSRSSRSLSTNSNSSTPATNQNTGNIISESSKECNEDISLKERSFDEDEDFLGFEAPDTESSKELIQKIYNSISSSSSSHENSTLNDDYFAGFPSSEPSKEQKTATDDVETGDTDSNLGLYTPTTSSSRKVHRSSKKSLNIDLSLPEFKKPFEYGWVRELVYRSTSDNSVKRNADIYYYTPAGKKVRSSREILEHLTGDLALENFSFFKEPIGLDDPTKEIIREAKSKPGPRSSEDHVPEKSVTPKVKIAPMTPRSTPKETKTSTTPKVVFRANAIPKIRGTPLVIKNKFDKKRKSAGPDDVDVIMESPEWNNEQKSDTNGLKRPSESIDNILPQKRSRPSHSREERVQPVARVAPAYFNKPQNFFDNMSAGFLGLFHMFQYLKVQELLNAAQVCKLWHLISTHNNLWEIVRMKNSRVSDWSGFARTLRYHGTKTLDLRKMIVPDSPEDLAKMWEEVCEAVRTIKTLEKIDLGRCSPVAFSSMAEAAPQLKSLVSLAIRGNEINLLPVVNCTHLTELKLKAVSGGLEIKDLTCLKELKNLKTLALTTIKNLNGIENYLPEGLVSLELGECCHLSKDVAIKALPRLVSLKRLRLEKGQNDCPTMALLEAVSYLPQLKQLELINFDIKPGFDKALARCTNLRTLLIIPTYVTQSATTNHVVMGGVAKLSSTLTYFIWGLTLELLKVTDLFIGQVETQKGNKVIAQQPKRAGGGGDSIPILKPSTDGEVKEGSQAPSQVDILALPNLQRVLSTLLPTTKIKILKVPFSATWRQTVTDAP